MDTINVIYGRNYSVGSVLIRAGQWFGPWSHCAVVLPGWDRVIEARAFDGVISTPLSDFLERYTAWEMVEVSVPDAEAGLEWGLTKLGAGYDYGAVARFISSSLPGADEKPERFHCVELVETIVFKAGLKRFRVPLYTINVSTSYAAI